MPKFKDDPPGPTSNVYIRVAEDVQERVKKAHKEGIQSGSSEAAFYGYLIKLGINLYERQILPIERGDVDPVIMSRIAPKPQNKTKMLDGVIRTLYIMAEGIVKNPNFSDQRIAFFKRLNEEGPSEALLDGLKEMIRKYGTDPDEILKKIG
jgi:hypothetical protein